MYTHALIAELKNALESGAHPRLTALSRAEKQAWIETFLRECSYAELPRDERGIVRAYVQAVTGYSRAQMARYVSAHAAPAAGQPADASPARRPRFYRSVVGAAAVLALLLLIAVPRMIDRSPLAFLNAQTIAPAVPGDRVHTVTVRTIGADGEPTNLFSLRTPERIVEKTVREKTVVVQQQAHVPTSTTLHERVTARRDARLLIGNRGEVFVQGVPPGLGGSAPRSLVEMLGAGNDGQVLTYSNGHYVWAYPNFSGTARVPTQSGSTRRYGGGGAQEQAPGQNITNNYITQGGTGLGVFVGTTAVTSYTGQLVSGSDTGYEAANAICAAEFEGSHLCMTDEILTTVQTQDISTLFSGVPDAWIAEGPPGFTANSNDCRGWTSADASYLGPWWEFDSTGGGVGFLTNCSTTKPLACCE